MSLQFEPRVTLNSQWYDVPGYKAQVHVLESPSPDKQQYEPYQHKGSSSSSAIHHEEGDEEEVKEEEENKEEHEVCEEKNVGHNKKSKRNRKKSQNQQQQQQQNHQQHQEQQQQQLSYYNYYGRSPIILVHGMVVASSYMRKLGERLAPWFKVYIPDQPGFGQSTKALDASQRATIPDMATFLHEFIKTIKTEKVTLVGNSLGCQIIVDFVRRFPKNVDRIVLQGPTMDAAKRTQISHALNFALNNTHEPVSMFFIMCKDYWQAGTRRAKQTLDTLQEYSIEEKMKDIKVPTLFLSGEYDTISPVEWCLNLQKLTPGSVFFPLRKTPHTANFACPDRMARIVCRYLLTRDDQMIQASGAEILKDFKTRNGRSPSLLKNFFSLVTIPWFFVFSMIKFFIIQILSLLPYIGEGIDDTEEEEIYTPIPNVADFDSASAMMRATSRALHFRDFPYLGAALSSAKYAPLVNFFPRQLRAWTYSVFGAMEATNEKTLNEMDCEEMAEAVTKHYPSAQYPIVAIGSSCGALTHIYGSGGIPWLPQTLLMAVHRPRKAAIRDGQLDMTMEMKWGEKIAKRFLERNPDIQLHHMADANQDQLMVERMAYFRLKRRALGKHYSKFLMSNLCKGGTILIVDCKASWNVVKISDRHYFQPGAVGGLTADEYVTGTEQTAKFIASQTSIFRKIWNGVRGVPSRKDWNSPTPTGTGPEAEWGFEESLGVDVEKFAKKNGFHVQRLVCDYAEDLSPLVSDYYQQWYKSMNHIPKQLLVENFVMIEPYWSVRLGLVPFWGLFPVQRSAAALRRYMQSCEKRGIKYTNGYLMLFCSGVDSVGFANIEDWRNSIAIPSKLLGVDESKFPADFGYPAKFNKDIKNLTKTINPIPMPPLMDYKHFLQFVQKNGGTYGVSLSA